MKTAPARWDSFDAQGRARRFLSLHPGSEGNYGFMLTAVDAELTPSTGVDLFRIKIWDKDNSDVIVYDNQMGDADDADPTTVLGGGSIVIHKDMFPEMEGKRGRTCRCLCTSRGCSLHQLSRLRCTLGGAAGSIAARTDKRGSRPLGCRLMLALTASRQAEMKSESLCISAHPEGRYRSKHRPPVSLDWLMKVRISYPAWVE